MNGTQRLWKFTIDGKNPTVILPDVWTPDGTLLMAHDGKLHAWKAGETAWRTVADLAALGLGNVTRLAVSPKGERIAIVAVPRVGPGH